jgi:uncharacterized lipoprotein YddW (UPF0748 family)
VRALALAGPLFMLVALVACGADAGSDPSEPPAPPAAPPAPSAEPVPPAPALVVEHERDFRAAWISYVWNGTWPSRSDLSEAASKAELVLLLDGLAAARMNAVFLQVRTEGDALYPSTRAPWARFLTGTMGQDPGWDPLAFAIEEAHVRGIELHAWLNPYRALSTTQVTPPPSHVTKRMPSVTIPWGNQLLLDPAAPEVRTEVKDVIREILQRYDVDGIHFDDYFYPYPVQGLTFPDQARFDAYVASGGTLDKLAWRRENVNTLVREVSALVAAERPDVRFGISPFGIYKPGVPEGITGLDAYNEIACDPLTWLDQGWVDYLVPQLYWQTTREKQAFGKLVTWWASQAKDGRSIFVGHDVTHLGEPGWPREEIDLQMQLSRAERSAGKGLLGNVFFTARPLAEDKLGVRSSLAASFWKAPAATPPLATALGAPGPEAPSVSREGADLNVAASGGGHHPRAFAIYDLSGTSPSLARLVPARASGATRIPLASGRWAITVVDRRGLESPGVEVE